jgi:hypothetical protein
VHTRYPPPPSTQRKNRFGNPASGTTGGLDHPLLTFEALDDVAPLGAPRPGTLRAAVEAARAAGGGWITPGPGLPAGATVTLRGPLRLPSNTTLDGGCQGLELIAGPRSAMVLLIGTQNAVVTRWRMHAPPENLASDRPGDCLGVGGGADRVWLAYNSFGRCGDGVVDITQSTTLPTPTRATVAFNHFTDHDKVMLLATLDCGQQRRPAGLVCPRPLAPGWSWEAGVQVTLQGNVFERTGQRHPRVSGQVYVHMLDNVVAYRPFRREGTGSLGASYGLLVGGGARLFLDHGVFLPLDPRSGYAARVPEPRDPAREEGPGALRILAARAGGGALLAPHAPELVPDPPYRLAGRMSLDPATPGLVTAAARCTGPAADRAACGHLPSR